MMSLISDSFIVYDRPQINDSGFSFIGAPKPIIQKTPTINITVFKGDYQVAQFEQKYDITTDNKVLTSVGNKNFCKIQIDQPQQNVIFELLSNNNRIYVKSSNDQESYLIIENQQEVEIQGTLNIHDLWLAVIGDDLHVYADEYQTYEITQFKIQSNRPTILHAQLNHKQTLAGSIQKTENGYSYKHLSGIINSKLKLSPQIPIELKSQYMFDIGQTNKILFEY